MNRMIATAGLLALVFVLNGCGSDSTADLMETNDKINKELDSVKSQLSTVVATETATATKLDAVRILANNDDEQLRANVRDFKRSKLELDALKLKLAYLETQLAAANQSKGASVDHSGRTTEQISAARDYHFEKITFDTTLPQFKDLYPKIGDPTRSKLGESTYEISSAPVGTVSITFLDDRVMTVSLRYGEQQIEELGGQKALLKRLAAKFGEPDSIENDTAKWMFASADRFILVSIGEKAGPVLVTFGKASEITERDDRMRKQDAGF